MPRDESDQSELSRLLLTRRQGSLAAAAPLVLLPGIASLGALLAVHGCDHGGGANTALLIAAAVVAALIGGTPVLMAFTRATPAPVVASRRKWRTINTMLILSSLGWAMILPLAVRIFPAPGPATVTAIGVAILFTGTIANRAAPAAALFHIAALTSGITAAHLTAAGPASRPLLALIAVYGVGLIAILIISDRRFRHGSRVELERRASERTVRTLLSEHEAQAADWPWTVDEGGALRDVSERLAGSVHGTEDALAGQDFLSMLEPGRERDRIAALIAARSTFRDMSATVVVDGKRRFWRLSGHPLADGGMTGGGRDVTDQRELDERVRAMAHVDPLTGLANRHLFNQRLRELLAGPGAGTQAAALLYIDVDDFKSVNDVHGHIFGDSLLRELGNRLRRESGDGDLVARLGGDEFAILVETAAGDGMLIERAHRLLAAAREPFQIEGSAARVSISIGIARSGDGRDATELMRRVDLALHAAKAKGRDQMELFEEALDRRARERRALELELREAVARDEMVLYYQPIIALQSGATVGYEALLRWRHPERGLLLPGEFLHIAEQSGLIVGLGEWVIRTALFDVSAWRGDFRIALNLSPSQIRSPHLIATIDGALAASGIAPGRLELEITENVFLDDAATGAAAIARLRALGAEIALDDFGTGYSSLSYLRRYRFDRVKIDRAFVQDIDTSDEALAIVSAITRLAQALGMKTTAEGVERPEQLDLLRKLGCDEAQGFLILEPVEAARIEQARMRGDDMPELAQEIEGYREARRAALAVAGHRR